MRAHARKKPTRREVRLAVCVQLPVRVSDDLEYRVELGLRRVFQQLLVNRTLRVVNELMYRNGKAEVVSHHARARRSNATAEDGTYVISAE